MTVCWLVDCQKIKPDDKLKCDAVIGCDYHKRAAKNQRNSESDSKFFLKKKVQASQNDMSAGIILISGD